MAELVKNTPDGVNFSRQSTISLKQLQQPRSGVMFIVRSVASTLTPLGVKCVERLTGHTELLKEFATPHTPLAINIELLTEFFEARFY